jgi:hypothetical protein
MVQLFLSHSSADDGFVRELRQALADLDQEVWIDSRQPLSSCQCLREFSPAEQGQYLHLISSTDSASPSLNDQKPSRSSAFMARLLRVALI